MSDLQRAAAILDRARPVAVFTGAGVSTESGLPDFRSAGGLWAGVDPMEVASLSAFRARPKAFYEFYRTRLAALGHAQPNAAHRALAELETAGIVGSVITQNVDGLHQAAGSRDVVELHGNLREAACPHCGWVGPNTVITDALAAAKMPTCPVCAQAVKPNVVLFEELLPVVAYERAEQICRRAGALLIVGSSLQVTPAAWLPDVILESGGAVVIVNDEMTPMDARADVVLRGRAGIVLPDLAAVVISIQDSTSLETH